MNTHDPRHRLQATADAHWDKYLSCVHTGGTREQRESAFDRWLQADQDLSRYDRVAGTLAETQEAA